MVSLTVVKASNACIPTTLPPGLVAIFVGGTSGIGEYTLKEFARLAREPRIYNIECNELNAKVQYTFIQADISLIRSVNAVCEQIQAKEKAVNILFLSAGTLVSGTKTEEGLHFTASLKHHSRARFILNLLPLLKAATGIRRVVSVLSGTKEGIIDLGDLQGWEARDVITQRGHSSAIATLILAHFAKQAPAISFIHDYPGFVKSGIARGTTGLLWGFLTVSKLLGSLLYIPEQESAERHLFLATSARFHAKEGVEEAVPLGEGVIVAKGIDGVEGSGVYSIDQVNESAGPAVQELLEKFKKEGLVEKIWGTIEEDYERIAKLPR
ncbi:hypothetical protein N431DRAFT_549262 [Stipitochalara longipes BDJ]|nr:hypothetical protein N431DRAFT_549262 [Stipitochalara longipes BDJ]